MLITNPNNPTGTLLTLEEIIAFIKEVPPQVLVVIDEVLYIEFAAQHSSVSLIQEFDNLIVLRSFSKAYGLAALRIGYAMSGASIAKVL